LQESGQRITQTDEAALQLCRAMLDGCQGQNYERQAVLCWPCWGPCRHPMLAATGGTAARILSNVEEPFSVIARIEFQLVMQNSPSHTELFGSLSTMAGAETWPECLMTFVNPWPVQTLLPAWLRGRGTEAARLVWATVGKLMAGQPRCFDFLHTIPSLAFRSLRQA
jgi:hypothetical protein